MTSEWMRVMLEEIARKKREARDARVESDRRVGEAGLPASAGESGVGAAEGSANADGSHFPADG